MKPAKFDRPEPQTERGGDERGPRRRSIYNGRRLWTIAILIVISGLVTGAVWADWYYGLPKDAQARFVGRQSCIQCHQGEHEAWTGSHHDLAMDVATDESVLGDFNDAKLEHHGVISRMFKRDGKFFINTEGPDGALADFEIKYVFGVDPLQQYMVEFDRPANMPAREVARLQVLRVSWDTKAKKWFHLDPPDVAEKLDPSDDLHWTGVAQRWNNMCADCHSTNLQKNFDSQTLTYHTTFSEIDVSCEACHGPGSLHVQLAGALSPFWDRERGYALAQLKGQSNQTQPNHGQIHACAHCHSRRHVIQGKYTAGCNYYDYFSNELLTSASYHADGQILDEVYEYGSFVQSKMYHKGIKCTDCHDPHTARLKHEGNKVCTSCHQHSPGKYDGAIHHRHADNSAGSQCVNCHMPETTYMQVDPRRDHSFRVPRPDLSVKLGTPNACTGCHLKDPVLPGKGTGDEGQGTGIIARQLLARAELKGKEYAEWLRLGSQGDEAIKTHLARVDRWADERLDAWYGKQRKREPHFAEALHAARMQSADAPQQLVELAGNRDQRAIARASAAAELAGYLDETSVEATLIDRLSDSDPQVRAAAVASLQSAEQSTLFRSVTSSLKDPRRVVRVEAARVLSSLPQHELRGNERLAMRQALQEAFASCDIDSDRAGGHLLRAVLHENLQQPGEAEAAYRTAMLVEPDAVGPRANLSAMLDRRREAIVAQVRQLAQAQNIEAAQKLLAEAGPLADEAHRLRDGELSLLERDALLLPDSPVLLRRLGFLRHMQGWGREAEHALHAAHLLEPQSPRFAFDWAVYLKDTGRPREALAIILKLKALRPGDEAIESFEREVREQLRAGPLP